MIGRKGKTILRNSRQQVCPPRRVCPFCIEGDHILGRRHNPNLIVEVCQLHHVQLTEGRLAVGADMRKQGKPIKSVEMALRSLAVAGHANASAINKLSEGLEFCAEKLKTYERSRRAGRKTPRKPKREERGE